jgi:hypothetical protein
MGIFDGAMKLIGVDPDQSSNDPNSSTFAGGSWNQFATDPEYKSKVYGIYDDLSLYGKNNLSPMVRPDPRTGLMPYQMAGMGVVAKNLFSQASAGSTVRGMNAPENQNAVVSSALMQALPNLFQVQNQNQLLPGEINKQNLFALSAPLEPLKTLGGLGNRSLGPGMEYNNINSGTSNWWNMWNNIGSFWGGGGGSAAAGNATPVMCYIAMELYGANDERVSLIRDYLNEQLDSESSIGRFARWYAANGKAIADGIGSGLISPQPWQAIFAQLRVLALGQQGSPGRLE